jgi:hypothetical protein
MGTKATTSSNLQVADPARFRVTYFDGHCNGVRWEDFDDEAAADLFARHRIYDENEWAIVDALANPVSRRAAA